MVDNDYDNIRISTCDTNSYGWDAKLHRFFPYIADKLRSMGFAVHRSVSYEVTDWDILKVGEITMPSPDPSDCQK